MSRISKFYFTVPIWNTLSIRSILGRVEQTSGDIDAFELHRDVSSSEKLFLEFHRTRGVLSTKSGYTY